MRCRCGREMFKRYSPEKQAMEFTCECGRKAESKDWDRLDGWIATAPEKAK